MIRIGVEVSTYSILLYVYTNNWCQGTVSTCLFLTSTCSAVLQDPLKIWPEDRWGPCTEWYNYTGAFDTWNSYLVWHYSRGCIHIQSMWGHFPLWMSSPTTGLISSHPSLAGHKLDALWWSQKPSGWCLPLAQVQSLCEHCAPPWIGWYLCPPWRAN